MGNFRLNDCMYHMVHFDNLENIFTRCALLSYHMRQKEGIASRSIALNTVQKLRERIFVVDMLEYRSRPLHSYVPFYFAKLTPMLYVQYINNLQREIVFLEVSRDILKDPGVIYTDGNAANQQLSDYGSQTVHVVPATLSNDIERNYSSGGVPQGTNFNRSAFFSDWKLLRQLNWEIIYYQDRFDSAEKKRIKHAEVLIPDMLPLERLKGIAVISQQQAEKVNKLVTKCGLEGRIPQAVCKPDLYFYQ